MAEREAYERYRSWRAVRGGVDVPGRSRTKYDPDKLVLVEGWARDGLTDEQIAHNLGITRQTLSEWKTRHPDIADALKRGKEVVDREVENALYKSALGFDYEEDMVTNQGNVVRVTKHQAPSTTAQIFWLKNRKPREWRDKQEVEHSTPVDRPMEVRLSVLSDEELNQLERILGKTATDTVSDQDRKGA